LKQADLRKLIKSGETETVEFKATFDKEVLETSVAFANTRGGVILIGVTGKGTEYILTHHKDAKDAIRPVYPSPLAGEPACR